MKILLDARLYGLENAGLGRYTMNLISNLVEQDKKNSYIVLLREKYFKELKLPSNWKKVLAEFRHYTVEEQLRLPLVIKKEKPDLVHFLSSYSPILYNGKFIVTIHDLLMQTQRGAAATTLPLYQYYPKHIAAKYVFAKTVEKAAKIIVPSNAVKKEVEDYYKVDPNKINVVYEGVKSNFTVSSRRLAVDSPYFIYVGNAYPHKNLERTIKAIVYLNEVQKETVYFTIASSRNVFTERLEAIISKLKAGKYIKLLGFVPDSDLGGLLKKSAGFIFPSLSEGFGLPGLEAMLAETVCLASNIPVFKEIYKDAAIYFDPFNVNSMARAIAHVLAMNDEQRSEIIRYAQNFVKRYSWSKMAKQTLDVYKRSL